LRPKRRAAEEKGPNVPAYLVTFSDMTTLLLTFFVMLASLASFQDKPRFKVGRESFLRSIKNLGLGMLYGRRDRPNFGNVKIRYFTNLPDESSSGRTIDAEEERIRRTFQNVSRSVKTASSPIAAKRTDFSVTDIYFAPGDATLGEPAKRLLTQFVMDLQQGPFSDDCSLCVLGLANDETTEKDQWIVSAKRAKAVADFLQDTFPEGSERLVYAWGAGPGGDWVLRDSPVSVQSQILIAVLRPQD
jgi:outer membrane protein OmpA-like peptidoglycan-associated protein